MQTHLAVPFSYSVYAMVYILPNVLCKANIATVAMPVRLWL